MEEKEFIKIYEKVVNEQQDIMQKTSKIKEEVDVLQKEYNTCDDEKKQEIMQKLEKLDAELQVLEKRSMKNRDRAKKLKSMK